MRARVLVPVLAALIGFAAGIVFEKTRVAGESGSRAGVSAAPTSIATPDTRGTKEAGESGQAPTCEVLRAAYDETANARDLAARSTVGSTGRALGALLPPEPPVANWEPGFDGPLQAAGVQAGSEKALLEKHGLIRGWSRTWVAPVPGGVFAEGALVLTVYEFPVGAQAAGFEASFLDARCDGTFDAFAVESIPGAVGVEQRLDGVVYDLISFVRGPRYFRLEFGRPPRLHDRQEAVRAATRVAELNLSGPSR